MCLTLRRCFQEPFDVSSLSTVFRSSPHDDHWLLHFHARRALPISKRLKASATHTPQHSAPKARQAAAVFARDGIEMEPNMPNVVGQDAIRKRYTDMMAGFDTDMQLKSEETDVDGNSASTAAGSDCTSYGKGCKIDPAHGHGPGEYLVILRKQADGS